MHRLELPVVLALGLLPQRPARRIARVGEQPIAHRLLVRVERLEVGDVEEHLAAHLDESRDAPRRRALRDARDLPHVLGDVLAHPAVAAGRGAREPTALVPQRQREAVDLQLAQVVHAPARVALDLRRPGEELLVAEDVVEAQHPLGVLDRSEQGAGRRADRQRRRVLALQLGVQPLDRLEPVHPVVVGRVVDDDGVLAVVGVARVEDPVGQRLRFGAGLVEGEARTMVGRSRQPSATPPV